MPRELRTHAFAHDAILDLFPIGAVSSDRVPCPRPVSVSSPGNLFLERFVEEFLRLEVMFGRRPSPAVDKYPEPREVRKLRIPVLSSVEVDDVGICFSATIVPRCRSA